MTSSQRLAHLGPDQDAQLERILLERARQPRSASPAADSGAPFPLSPQQLRIWFLAQLFPDLPLYNEAAAVRIDGPLDVRALELALREIVQRHESLRLSIQANGDSASQQVRPELAAAVLHVDLTDHPAPERALDECLRHIHRARFDLAQDPLFRFALIRLGRQEHVLVLVMHHVVCDASSFAILYRECAALYRAFSTGKTSPLPPSAGSLRHITEEQLAAHQRTYDVSLDYWRRQLEGVPELLELPSEKSRPPVASYAGARHRFHLGPELTASLREVCRQAGTTMFALFSAAFAAFLHRITDRDDIVFGIPVTARDTRSAERVVGCMVHTLPLRFRFAGDPAFSDLVRRAQQTTAEAYDHRGLPFERLVEALGVPRSAGHAPVVQVVLNWRARDHVPSFADWDELRLTDIPLHSDTAKFDFQARFREGETSLEGEIEYRTDLFEPATISRLAGHFATLLESVVEDVHRPVSQLALIDPAARSELVEHGNRTKTPYPQLPVHRVFEAVAGHSPDAVALVDETHAITYNDLNRRANRLARRLRALHVYPGTTVGIAMPRRVDTVIAMLAVLKAGGAYLPLDPAYPPDVLVFLVQDAGAALVLTCDALCFPAVAVPVFDVRDDCGDESAENLDLDIGPDHLAYVMYTSGSTGRPKGVEISHRGIVRLVCEQQYAAFGPREVFLHFAPFSFDAATFEIWGALLHGARCVLFPEDASILQHLEGLVRKHGITTAWLTASLFNTIVDAVPESLRGVKQLLIGGEALSVGHVIRAMEALPGTVVVNGYGPTESTTFTCCHRIAPGELAGAASVPIGVPVANTEVYVLDRYRQLVPVGVPGELYIGGDGLARGYRNRPDLTRAAFVDHPFRPGARLYRSGDIVRWSPRGYLEFLGRTDDQLKIRGFRIEPAEIAAVLRSHPAVQDACVGSVGMAATRTLAAYFVLRRPGAVGVALLREFLTARLPTHMVPASLSEVDALPLTRNGKVDVRALPHRAAPSGEVLEPPRDRIEQMLHKIWSNLLPEKQFGIRDNFFELGGHSLLAARLFLDIEALLGRSVPLATLFHAPTIEALAAALRSDVAAATWSPLVAIQSKGSKPPFFAVHGIGGNLLSYRALAKYLPQDQPFYGLQARGLDGKTPPHTRVEDMAADYIKEIRRIQPAGPYYIGGLSFGCPVALEMAQQLRSAGEELALLALLDGGLRGAKDLLPRHQRLTRLALFQLSRLYMHLAALGKLRPHDIRGFFRRKRTTMARRLRSLIWQVRYLGYESAGAELPAHLRRVEEGAYLAAKRYVPRYYDGRAVLFRSVDGPKLRFVDEHMGWGIVIRGGLEVRHVPGDHLTMTREPHVRALARELTAVLSASRRNAPRIIESRETSPTDELRVAPVWHPHSL